MIDGNMRVPVPAVREHTQVNPIHPAVHVEAQVPLADGAAPKSVDAYYMASTRNASKPLPFNPADRLFDASNRFNPLTYVTKEEGVLPEAQPSEFRFLHQVRDAQTPAELNAAFLLAEVGTGPLWFNYANQITAGMEPEKAAMVKGLLQAVLDAAGAATGTGKAANKSLRPYQLDSTLPLLGEAPGGYAYPSGHSAMSHAAATLLSAFAPERAEELFRAAANVSRSRMELGVHSAGDVAAGARLGVAVARNTLTTMGMWPAEK